MRKLLLVLVGACALATAPAQAQGQESLKLQATIEYLCEKEKAVTRPEQSVLTRCQTTFIHGVTELWFYYETTEDLRAVPCRKSSPGSWCEEPRRDFTVRVLHFASLLPRHEEFLIDNGSTGTVDFGVDQSDWHEARRFDAAVPADYWDPGREARGPEHEVTWQLRFDELLLILQERIARERSES